jgi:S1-C subfamily serine protease
MKGGPAEKAGLGAGDLIVALAGTSIENIYDYVRVINMLKVGKPVQVTILRDSARYELTLTPEPKE